MALPSSKAADVAAKEAALHENVVSALAHSSDVTPLFFALF
jgi:hypothetical protein